MTTSFHACSNNSTKTNLQVLTGMQADAAIEVKGTSSCCQIWYLSTNEPCQFAREELISNPTAKNDS